MDEQNPTDPSNPEHIERRKPGGGLWMTHKQVYSGGALIAALAMISPLKEWFFTREEGVAQVQRLERTELALATLKNDINARIDRSTDKIVDRIKESENRQMTTADRIERRIDRVESRQDSIEIAGRLFGVKTKKVDN